jgi:hypothetical protein
MARMARLRKQRCFLCRKKVEITRRNLYFLDKLDTAKAKESEKRKARDREIPAPVSDILDLPSILDLDNFNLDPAFWKILDFSGKTF